MGQALYFVPPRGQFVDPTTGELTRVADLFLRGLYARVGGAVGDSTGDLSEAAFDDAGTEEQEAALYALADSLNRSPTHSAASAEDADQGPTALQISQQDALAAEMAQLREELATLRQQINDLSQGQQL